MNSDILFGGVIGYPIGHSLSPEIFRVLAHGLKKPFAYRPLAVEAKGLNRFLKTAKDVGLFRGLNVTIPHKEAVIGSLDSCSPAALVLGAANVIHLQGKELVGHNTDVFGVLQTWREHQIPVKGKKLVLIGAGGAALAVGYAAGLEQATEVLIYNRTLARAKKVAKRLALHFPKTRFLAKTWVSEGIESGASLYVNATPVGMSGFPVEKFFSNFPKAKQPVWAFDLVYRPARTPFLREASERGFKTVGGLDMLVWQALEAWKIWMGPIPHATLWKKRITRRLNVVLSAAERKK